MPSGSHLRIDSANNTSAPSGSNNTSKYEALDRYPVYRDFAATDFHVVIQNLCVDADVTQKLSEDYAQDLFPSKLHFMIESSATCQQFSDIIYWLPHGRAFVFYNQDRLVHELLPLHFSKQHKFASFQRQLNLYGFLKLMGNHVIKGAYYHELFLRGRPELSKLMVPIRHTEASRCSVRRKLDPRSEPNFCRMAPAPPSSHIVASAPLNLLPSTTNTNVTPKATAVGRTHASDGSRRNSVQIKTPLEIRDVTFYDPSVSLDRSVAVAPSSRPSHPIQSFNEVVLCPLVETSGCTSTTPVSPPPAGEALIERKHLPAFAAPGEMSPSCQRIPQAIDVPLLILLDSPNLAAVSSTKRGNNDKSHMQYLEDPFAKVAGSTSRD